MNNTDDEAIRRLLDYHGRRYRLSNGWFLRFQVKEAPVTEGRPHGIKYAFTLHDADMKRLLGIDNAHGIPQRVIFDHRHRFRRTETLVPYDYKDADTLIVDFFAAVERALRSEGAEFSFDDDEIETEAEDDEDIAD